MPGRELAVAYTPDSDDAFCFYAWQHGRVAFEPAGWTVRFERDHIPQLNRAAQAQEFEVVAISSAAYPLVAGHYRILTVGNSVGRRIGPVLVSKRCRTVRELRGRRIAVGGMPTTGGALALMYAEDPELVELPYDQIVDAIERDQIDAGVMIHEEILYFRERGLHLVLDLGSAWREDTGLPLPVGLNLVHRRLGDELARQIATCCQRSLLYALDHREEAYRFASRFGRGLAREHVEMFQPQDTLWLADDLRAALPIMFEQAAKLGLGPPVDRVEIVDGDLSGHVIDGPTRA